MRLRHLAFPWLCAFLLAFPFLAGAEMPDKPGGWVNDFARVMDDESKATMTALLEDLQKTTGIQVAVVTVTSLDNTTVEDYAEKLFKKWGIGRAQEDDGVLLLIAPTERKVRIEVGYGMEPVITDGRAGRIIRESIIPHFKSNDYGQGALQGAEQIAGLIRSQGASMPDAGNTPATEETWQFKTFVVIFFGIFVTIGFLALGSGIRGGGFTLIIWGLFFGGMPLAMSFLFAHAMGIPNFILPGWAGIMLLTGLIRGKKLKMFKSGVRVSIGVGPFSWHSGGRGGGFGGGSSFGGFGGGSSGGGGASGSW